ncbi:unnamed protein product [Cunninghamella blakesleeana]
MELESRFEPFISGAPELQVINAVDILRSGQTDETTTLNALQFLLHKATFNEDRGARMKLSIIYAEGVEPYIKQDQQEATMWARSIYDKQLSKALVSCHQLLLLDDTTSTTTTATTTTTTLYTTLLSKKEKDDNQQINIFSTLQLILYLTQNNDNDNDNDNGHHDIDITPLFYLAGLLWMKGIGVQQDIQKSVSCFIEATRKGNHRESAYELGRIYSDRYPHSLNHPQQSIVWFRKALEWGDQRALVDLAYGYFEENNDNNDNNDNNNSNNNNNNNDHHQPVYSNNNSNHVENYNNQINNNNNNIKSKNDELAFKYAQQGAIEEDRYCQYILGYLYLKGRGTKEDAFEAIGWLEKSAQQGFTEAIEELTAVYLRGHGNVAKDEKKAYSICMLGADHIPFCQATLGDMYRNGWGVGRDYQKAFQYYQTAASHNEPYPYAQHMMGEMFLNGEGVPYDFGVAKENFIMAAKQYYEPSKHKLETLEKTMQFSGQSMTASPTAITPPPLPPPSSPSDKKTNRWSIGTIFSKKK